jgi:hypothetical protein
MERKLNLFSERRILLRRDATGFGFNILGDEGESGTFIFLNVYFMLKMFYFIRCICISYSTWWCS